MAKNFKYISRYFACILLISLFLEPLSVLAQNYTASQVMARSEIFFAPASGTFIEGSTFDVPIFINTGGNSINTIELNVRFDPAKLAVVKPSGGKSIIELWVEPPTYNNTTGTLKFTGIVPNGIKTTNGLIANVTFQAKNSGQAIVSVRDTSRVLVNDGIGTPISVVSNRGTYSIVPRPPEGIEVYSETHPFQDHWYNNNSPVFSWNKDIGITGFSYVIDNKPNTVPDNQVSTTDNVAAVVNLHDGLWYFHIKAQKKGVWGGTTHRLVRIDTTPPADFTPTVNYLAAVVINHSLISFHTTDSLSGMDHYEVGVIDKTHSAEESPSFIQSESPYQLRLDNVDRATVIVRAIDRAGNVRDASVDVAVPFIPLVFITENLAWIFLGLLLLAILMIMMHYLFGHRTKSKQQATYSSPQPRPEPLPPAVPRPLQSTIAVQNRVAPPVPPPATFTENVLRTEDSTYQPLSNEELLGRFNSQSPQPPSQSPSQNPPNVSLGS